MPSSGRENLSNKRPTYVLSSNFATGSIACLTMASTVRFISSFLIPPMCSSHGQHAQKRGVLDHSNSHRARGEIKINSPIIESTWSRAHQNRHGQGITAQRPRPLCHPMEMRASRMIDPMAKCSVSAWARAANCSASGQGRGLGLGYGAGAGAVWPQHPCIPARRVPGRPASAVLLGRGSTAGSSAVLQA